MGKRFQNSTVMYALGMFAMMIPSQAFSTFYVYFYTDVMGLSLVFATIARMVYTIWDAVNQPLAGYFSDRTRTKYGRRKPWLIGAVPLLMLSFIMVFSVPGGMSNTGMFAWFLVAIVLFEAIATIIWVNYGALLPELYQGDRIRAKASAVQNGFQIVAILVASILTMPLVESIGYSNMSVVFAALFAIFMLWFISSIKEDPEAIKEPKIKFVEGFSETLKNKEFWIFNISNSFAQTVNGLLSATIPFWGKYVLGISEGEITYLLAAVFVSVIPFVFVWYWIIKKLGGYRSWRLAIVVYAISVIPLWFSSDLITGIVAGICVGFGLAGFLVTPPVLTGTIIDQDTEKTGKRREGIYVAVGGFITRSSGLISVLAFWIVGMIFGYVSGEQPGPNPEATFRYLISAVPFILLVVAIIISLFLKDFTKISRIAASQDTSLNADK
ncbi:MFS transporter [Paenibacillus sp. KN14-4R]|uniref:MFS transporter n=1 Tax=Paenibacillus sp. KN14-4R TaxID=3445773 RepID=UPI003F9FDE71